MPSKVFSIRFSDNEIRLLESLVPMMGAKTKAGAIKMMVYALSASKGLSIVPQDTDVLDVEGKLKVKS